MNFLLKFLFNCRRPKVIVVSGKGSVLSGEAIYSVLKKHFRVKKLNGPPRFHHFFQLLNKDIFIITDNPKKPTLLNNRYLVEKSSLPIIVVTQVGDIPPEADSFFGDQEGATEIKKITEFLPGRGYLVLNFDDEAVREIKNLTNANSLSFGFQEKADIWISDVNSDINETNFKINYQGKIVPIWLKNIVGKEQIYASLSAVAVGTILGLNLVEISQALRNYRGLLTK